MSDRKNIETDLYKKDTKYLKSNKQHPQKISTSHSEHQHVNNFAQKV